MLFRKSLAFEFKEDGDTPGSFRATFSRLQAIDHDYDVTLPGAFERGQKVRIAQWGHAWNLPIIGTGVIDADESTAWVDGRFNLNMTAGRDTYESVKDAGELQEWSYGFDILESSDGDFEGQPVRYLKKLKVHEVSPVMLGAGIGTHTDSIKSNPELTHDEHANAVLAAVKAWIERTEALAALRMKDGRTLSHEAEGRVEMLLAGIRDAETRLEAVLAAKAIEPSEPTPDDTQTPASPATGLSNHARARLALARFEFDTGALR